MSGRYLSVTCILLGAVLLLNLRGKTPIVLPHEPLSAVPYAIQGWAGHDVTIDQDTLHVLGPGEFLSRLYSRVGYASPIGLFIAYFPTQKTGDTIHSPQHCLPGAGWSFDSVKYVRLTDAAGKTHQVGEYVISNGDMKQFVIYWYLAHGRSVASEYMAKFYLVTDAIRTDRTDGSLVRVMMPIDPTNGVEATKSLVESFTEQLMPDLPRYIPN